jgi:hypothetical protein
MSEEPKPKDARTTEEKRRDARLVLQRLDGRQDIDQLP